MVHILVLFLDGLGLGSDNPDINPLSIARMPNLIDVLEGRRLIAGSPVFKGKLASLFSLDAQLGVSGTPQSATGQAVLLTGCNIPKQIGEHYGPKPNPSIVAILQKHNIFIEVRRRGGTATLINAYPPGYFDAIERRRRIYSAIPLAVTAAGIDLKTAEDLHKGQALSPDFTGKGWVSQPNFPSIPIYSPTQAGERLARLSQRQQLTWFDYWLSDYAGHRGTLKQATELLETFDLVLGGLIDHWRKEQDLIVLISDHGNIEDMSGRGHTSNPIPLLLIGPLKLRDQFTEDLKDLTSFYHGLLRVLFPSSIT